MLPPEATAMSDQPSISSTPRSASRSVSIRATPPAESLIEPVISEFSEIAATRSSNARGPICSASVWPTSAATCCAVVSLITISFAPTPDIAKSPPRSSGTAPTRSASAGSTPTSQKVGSESRVSRLRTETGAKRSPKTPSTRGSPANCRRRSSIT